MTWLLIGIGYALVLFLALGLCCAAADADWVANHVLTSNEDDELEMRIAASMDYGIYGRWTA